MSKRMARKIPCVLGSLAVMCMAASSANAGLIVNRDFEAPEDGTPVPGWTGEGKLDGRAAGGKRALLLSAKTRTNCVKASQILPLEGGRKYSVGCSIKTIGLTGDGGARLQLEAFSADGRRVAFFETRSVFTTHDRYIDLPMPCEFPMDAVRFVFSAVLLDGAGEALFDNFRVVKKTAPEALGVFASSAYRNTAVRGRVKFAVAVLHDERTCMERGYTGVFRIPNGKRSLSEKPARVVDGGVSYEMDVADLPMGKHPVQFILKDRDGKEAGFRELMFNRIAEAPKKGVWFDHRHIAYVDGKPFFPLGCYTAFSDRYLKLLKDSPYNCLVASPAPKVLDACHAAGLKVLGAIGTSYAKSGKWVPKEIKTRRDESAWVCDVVEKVRNHPALLAWYTSDEWPVSFAGRLIERRALLEEIDPAHPVWTVQYQVRYHRDYRSYMGTFDVGGTDPYPVFWKGEGRCRIDKPTRWTRATREDMFGLYPMWQVPQFFDGGSCYRHLKDGSRAPTEAEFLCMVWQCIAEGANGIVFYALDHVNPVDSSRPPFEQKWAEACRVGESVKEKFPVLFSDDITARVKTKSGTTRVRAWDGPGGPIALAVNASYKPLRVEFEFDGRPFAVDLGPLGHKFVPCGGAGK